MGRFAVSLVSVLAAASIFGAASAFAQPTGLEYRLTVDEAQPGDIFAYDHGEALRFVRQPFMAGRDFAGAAVRRPKNPGEGEWAVALRYTPAGRAKFLAAMKANGGRQFCLVFHNVVQVCDTFAFDAEAANADGAAIGEIYGRAKAERLAARMRGEIAKSR